MSLDQHATDKSPRELFETLARVLREVELSEIAISPYIIPPDDTSHESSQSENAKIHPFTLIEGDKLAIPQKPLYALFAYCIVALSAYPRNVLGSTSSIAASTSGAVHIAQSHGLGDTSQGRDLDLEITLDNLTKCIIVQNPEHGRAMNIRKRLILQRMHDDPCKRRQLSKRQIIEVISRELHFVKLVLGIAANSKMGSLWHHRRWLLQIRHALCDEAVGVHPRSYSLPASSTLLAHENMNLLHRSTSPVPLTHLEYTNELALVELCAERYSRNYQAWAYRIWLLQGQLQTARRSKHAKDEDDGNKAGDMLSEESRFAMSHLGRNIGDHTAASYLIFVLYESKFIESKTARQDATITGGQSDERRLFEKLLAQAAEFTLDFVRRYPHKETPWLLLRGMIWLSRERQAETTASTSHLQLDNEALSLAEELSVSSRDGHEESKTARVARLASFVLQAQSNAALGGGAALQALQMS